jgi:hypothetical protein
MKQFLVPICFGLSVAASAQGGKVDTLQVEGDDKALVISGPMKMTVEGRQLDLLSTPGMPSSLTLSRELASTFFGDEAGKFDEKSRTMRALGQLFDLEPRFRNQTAMIGAVKINGLMRTAQISFTGQNYRENLEWHERDLIAGQSLIGGPFALPAPIIRYALKPRLANESSWTMPLAPAHTRRFAGTKVKVGKADIVLVFAPQFPRTIASAAAASALATNFSGKFSGVLGSTEIMHGVKRPTKEVVLETPFRAGPIIINRFLARMRDFGSTSQITDPSENDGQGGTDIIVKAKGKKSKPEYFVYLGADVLGRCSSITFHKPSSRIILRCAN